MKAKLVGQESSHYQEHPIKQDALLEEELRSQWLRWSHLKSKERSVFYEPKWFFPLISLLRSTLMAQISQRIHRCKDSAPELIISPHTQLLSTAATYVTFLSINISPLSISFKEVHASSILQFNFLIPNILEFNPFLFAVLSTKINKIK